jgi:hypothetical protein
MRGPQRYPYLPDEVIPGSPYQIQNVLGVGGMAVAYGAEDRSCGRRVVVKVVLPQVAQGGKFTAKQMEREARMLVALQQETENVVEVITAGVTGDDRQLPYYVMEMLSGHTLRAELDRRRQQKEPLAIDEAIAIAADLATALGHAHRMGITHLDVKPENAFIHQKRDGTRIVKLLDFGISAMIGETIGGFRGTYRYAAREQIRGERVSPATDIYALGLVAFETVTLLRPFETDGSTLTAAQYAHAHCERMPPSAGLVRPDVPEALAVLIAQCLEKEPGRRPPSMPFVVSRLREARRAFEEQQAAPPSAASTTVTVDYAPAQRGPFGQTLRLAGGRPEASVQTEHGSELFVEPRPPAKSNRVTAALIAVVSTAALALLLVVGIQRARSSRGAAAGTAGSVTSAPQTSNAASAAIGPSPASTNPASAVPDAPSAAPSTSVATTPAAPAAAGSRRPNATAAPPAGSIPGIVTKRNWF